MPRFVDVGGAPPRRRRVRNLLEQETVPMTVFAQDPSVADLHGPVLVQIPVPADRLQRGPRSHRFHVVDIAVGTNQAFRPAQRHDHGDAWSYTDRYAATTTADRLALIGDRDFRAQNVFAIAAHTLALFEQHLGRPIPWNRRAPQLFLVPQARIEANAWYSREHNAVLFGWLPSIGDEPPVYTALSYDIVAHEVTHAILDGLRPRYTAPGPPDQLAFHEALADLVALFSVFGLPGVAQDLLDPRGTGRYRFPRRAAGMSEPEVVAARADHLKRSPLAGLAEQLGRRQARPSDGRRALARAAPFRRPAGDGGVEARPDLRRAAPPGRGARGRRSCRRSSRSGPSGCSRWPSAVVAWTSRGSPRRASSPPPTCSACSCAPSTTCRRSTSSSPT